MSKAKKVDLRRQARIAALQSLFAADIRNGEEQSFLVWLAEEDGLPEEAVNIANWLFDGVVQQRAALDDVTQLYAPARPVEQLASVDRNILRIALFELLYNPDTPRKTAINEAVELAKMFGSGNSAKFVNGVLGSVMSGLEAGELATGNTALEGR